MKRNIIKASTLLLFVSLISGFVVYRSGGMEDVIQLSPNGGNVQVKKDSVKSDTTEELTIMPSSKVHIIAKPKTKKDTAKITSPAQTEPKRKQTMSSSKSMMILDSEIFGDTTQNKKEKE